MSQNDLKADSAIGIRRPVDNLEKVMVEWSALAFLLPREDILTHGLTNRGDLGETPPVKVMQPKEKRNKKYLNDADNLTRTLSRGQSHADYLTRTLSRADNLTQIISRRH